MPDRPIRNVMVLIADDWSPLARCYGDRVVQTPHIDRFAETATVFDRAFCVSPSCAVSRASLLTGLYPHTHGQFGHCHGIHGFRTHQHVRTLPAVARDQGVRSALIGKTHVAPPEVYPFEIFGGASQGRPDDQADCARNWLEEIGEAPFYLQLASGYPHRGGDASGWNLMHNGDQFHGEPTYDPGEVPIPDFLPDHPEARRDLAGYYQAVSRFDAFVGRQLEMLDASGRADETLVVITSDHAMPFVGAKASNFDTGHRCPLLVRYPGQRDGLHCDALVNWCDLTATFHEALGIPDEARPAELTGRSILPILDEPSPDGWDATWFSHCFHEVTNYFPYRVLRERRYKYVRNLAHELPMPLPSDLYRSWTWQAVREEGLAMMGGRPIERTLHHEREALFDVEADPLETKNLAGDPAHADRLAEMRQRTLAWRRWTEDPWLEVDYQEGDIESFEP